jgi:16S rRNA processing protein RimM
VTNTHPKPDWVVLAVVGAPHGVSGRLKVRSFTDPEGDFATHKELTDERGSPVKLRLTGHAGGAPVVAIDGVKDRNEAERWRGRKLGVPRTALPQLPENQFYTDDLVGMEVIDCTGIRFGEVTAIANYGAGDLLHIRRANGREEFFAFTHANFPNVDATARQLTIEPPELLGSKKEESLTSPLPEEE